MNSTRKVTCKHCGKAYVERKKPGAFSGYCSRRCRSYGAETVSVPEIDPVETEEVEKDETKELEPVSVEDGEDK